ncbi:MULTISPECIES: ImmA/IrrE family metallo-endopeptidase [unclassified Moraxella]|uniref:ImmA/IrrE family metallo-endopeptidase n=1 Tax=unclassified Moraxella TaxID=2685852 RepID=UPI00359D2497
MAKNLIKHSPLALRHYREQLSLSVELLAKKTKIPLDKLVKAEQETPVFTFKQVKDIAKVLLIDDFLLLTDTLSYPNIPNKIEYRNYIESDDEKTHYLQQKAVYELLNNRENLLYTYESMDTTPEPFLLKLSGNNAKDDATIIREWLGVDNAKLKTENSDDYYRSWRLLIEKKDVLVIELSAIKIGSEGMALYYETLPIIAILSLGQNPSRRLFTMIHELVHLGLNQSTIDGDILNSNEKIERYCNQVAGYVLLPEDIAKELYDNTLNLEQNILTIRKKIKVSKQAIAIQLKLLGYITQNELNDYFDDLLKETENKSKIVFIKSETKANNQFGKIYIQQVISAVWQNSITVNTALNMLHLKNVEQLTALEQKVFV